MKVLFICHNSKNFQAQTYSRHGCGLFNSTRFIVHAMRARGMKAHIVEVDDNNCIDREVHKYKPDVVVIEALWVVPDKFKVLMKLHPKVKRWMIHLHSNIPFLAMEGIAIEWLLKYQQLGLEVVANSDELYDSLSTILRKDECLVNLPNVYERPAYQPKRYREREDGSLHVGCFGAIRPMKNHVTQALAALAFARSKNLFLQFYINATRVEFGGLPILKNLRELFANVPDGNLVEVEWIDPELLPQYLHKHLDIGLQVSLTETFNVVSADYTVAGLPIVTSPKVKWVSHYNHAEAEDQNSIVAAMDRVLGSRTLVRWNQFLLARHGHKAANLWFDHFEEINGA